MIDPSFKGKIKRTIKGALGEQGVKVIKNILGK